MFYGLYIYGIYKKKNMKRNCYFILIFIKYSDIIMFTKSMQIKIFHFTKLITNYNLILFYYYLIINKKNNTYLMVNF